jgi:hypothetical protein
MNAEDVEGETRLMDSVIHTCRLRDVGNIKIIINNKNSLFVVFVKFDS